MGGRRGNRKKEMVLQKQVSKKARSVSFPQELPLRSWVLQVCTA
jgi:hypothetical protein